jgi:aspartate-semialdehyde dehydrogenase
MPLLPPSHKSNGQPLRLGIVGASTLRGKDIAQILDERPLPVPVAELRLLDDPNVSGTLTEAGGEPVVIQSLDEESLSGLDVVFFACEEAFAARHWAQAERAGAIVIDLSGALATVRSAFSWIPSLDAALSPAHSPGAKLFYSPGAAAIVACTVAAALRHFRVPRIAAVFFQPASELGTPGIEELESQTVKLLSFQPIAREVFDAQVAFNLLDRYGESCRVSLDESRAAIARDVARYLGPEVPLPAVQVIQAPVFYSIGFSIYVEFEKAYPVQEIERSLTAAGVNVASPEDPPTTNVSVAGQSGVTIGSIRRNSNLQSGYWLWGAVDNVRLAADNAVRIAEKILAGR